MATQTLPLREIEATEIKTVSILLKLDQSESGPDPTHSVLSIVDSTREILTGFNDPQDGIALSQGDRIPGFGADLRQH
jgi:hypothetical protein